MEDALGYKVMTTAGKEVGRVTDQTEDALIVISSGLRRRQRMLPKAHVLINDERETVVLCIPDERFLKSPLIDAHDSAARLDQYWGHRG